MVAAMKVTGLFVIFLGLWLLLLLNHRPGFICRYRWGRVVALPLNGARLAPFVLERLVFLRWRLRAPLPSTPARDADTHPLYSSQLASPVYAMYERYRAKQT